MGARAQLIALLFAISSNDHDVSGPIGGARGNPPQAVATARSKGDSDMRMARRLLADENGLSAIKWALLIAAAAAAVVMFVPQFGFIIARLERLGTWLGTGGFF